MKPASTASTPQCPSARPGVSALTRYSSTVTTKNILNGATALPPFSPNFLPLSKWSPSTRRISTSLAPNDSTVIHSPLPINSSAPSHSRRASPALPASPPRGSPQKSLPIRPSLAASSGSPPAWRRVSWLRFPFAKFPVLAKSPNARSAPSASKPSNNSPLTHRRNWKNSSANGARPSTAKRAAATPMNFSSTRSPNPSRTTTPSARTPPMSPKWNPSSAIFLKRPVSAFAKPGFPLARLRSPSATPASTPIPAPRPSPNLPNSTRKSSPSSSISFASIVTPNAKSGSWGSLFPSYRTAASNLTSSKPVAAKNSRNSPKPPITCAISSASHRSGSAVPSAGKIEFFHYWIPALNRLYFSHEFFRPTSPRPILTHWNLLESRQRGPRSRRPVVTVRRRRSLQLRLLRQGRRLGRGEPPPRMDASFPHRPATLLGYDEQALPGPPRHSAHRAHPAGFLGVQIRIPWPLHTRSGFPALLRTPELADKITIKRDLEIAREIQAWLVPSTPPPVPNAEVAFYTRPQNSVAGDYYDAFYPTRDAATGGKLLLVMADVAGKSIPAALLMATLQASLHTIASEGLPLTQLATRLNQYACAHSLGGQRFTTAVLAEYDPATQILSYVNAGHNSPVVRRANSSTERLESGGLPLGITPEATFPSADLQLQSGDTLVLFTDGVVEAFNSSGEEYSDARWLSVIRGLPILNAQQTLNFLMNSVSDFVGATRQSDDITCLVLRCS